MGELKMITEEIIATIITAIIGSGILNGIITHFLYSNKLKKELRAKNNNMFSEKISESLSYFRDVELILTTIEIYNFDEELEQNGAKVDLINKNCAYYLAIFDNWETFNDFFNKIQECRHEYEKYLSCKLALNLVFIDRYIMKLGLFMKQFGDDDLLPIFGTIFIFDLQKWQKRIDKMLVKEINKCTCKIESHESRKWKYMRKRELEKQWESTILHYMIEGKCDRRLEKKMNMTKAVLYASLAMKNK